jgi:hypothetical protein
MKPNPRSGSKNFTLPCMSEPTCHSVAVRLAGRSRRYVAQGADPPDGPVSRPRDTDLRQWHLALPSRHQRR